MMLNAKMIETALGMLARFLPPEIYQQGIVSINELTEQGRRIEARAAAVELRLAQLQQSIDTRLAMLEGIVRANVEGAEATYAEAAQWLVPGRMEAALAPARPNALEASQHDH